MDDDDEFKVLIAGGGVAGLEAVLALRETGLRTLSIDLLSPSPEFVLTPLSVAEAFGAGEAPRLGLAEFCDEHDVELIPAGLAEVWPEQQRALTDEGTELFYDALLLCTGARRRVVLPEALNFSGGGESGALEELVTSAKTAGSGRVSFVVPREVNWPLPLYELALQVADRLRGTDVEISFTTAEFRPLGIFGEDAARRVAEILDEAGIDLRAGEGADPPREAAGAEWVVTVPRLDVPPIPGVPQVSHGFVPVDTTMRVQGLSRVWAVGDITWSPIKQGGLAAQQADTAAADIAREAGADVHVPPYVPVLRAALLTAEGPFYLRSGTDEDGGQRAPLWWPPAKVAGRLLAPYLARKLDPTITAAPLVDRAVDPDRDAEHQEGLQLALRWAEIDAAEGEYRRALHWLDVAEGLNLVVPDRYREKRSEWEQRLEGANGN
jgi:sulfide:quinone oxidoreductase